MSNVSREDKGDQLMDYQQEVHATEDQLKKLQKEVILSETFNTRSIQFPELQI